PVTMTHAPPQRSHSRSAFSYPPRCRSIHRAFPTRRSSDLSTGTRVGRTGHLDLGSRCRVALGRGAGCGCHALPDKPAWGSGEQEDRKSTSELQSPYDLVCRLLLEKKKKHFTAFRHILSSYI